MTTPTPAALLEAALSAAALAADYLRALDRDDLGREYKSSHHDIVTEHDRACEEMIVAELLRLVPGARIVGEEGGVRPPAPATESSTADVVTFYVDPIDGTSNFAAGLPLFCISIGAAIGPDLVAGVIDAPALGQVFTAADGPAQLNGRYLRPRATRTADDALILTGYPGHGAHRIAPELASRHAAELGGVSAVRHLGSAALELAYVSAGWADATMLTWINPWDVAAGFHILERAGGSLRTWPGSRGADALPHERPAYVACRGQERLELLDRMMDEVQEMRERRER